MPSYDIVIAGYGPTGATAANLLGAQGLKVLVVDPSLEIFDIPRAVHLDGECMRIFQQTGLAHAIANGIRQISGLRFLNAKGHLLMEQHLAELPHPNYWDNDLMFNQPRLEGLLRESVEQFSNVEIRLGWGLQSIQQHDDQVEITLQASEGGETDTVQCAYLLSSDGASSPTREILGVHKEDLDCDKPWLVVDWILDDGEATEDWAYQFCDPARPGTLVPGEQAHVRWEFMLNPDDKADVIEDESAVRRMMAPHVHRLSPTLDAQSGKLKRAKIYNFHALVAETFQQGRVFLLGDAAHQTPPFLGQGMCAGIRDAYNLCWKVSGVLQGNYPAALLDTYTSERRPHAHEVITTAVNHGRIIQARNPLKAFLRDSFFRLARLFPSLLDSLDFHADWRLGEGLFAIDDAPTASNQLGRPLPQSKVSTADGSECLSDDLLGPGFTLMGFRVDPAEYMPSNCQLPGTELTVLSVGKIGGVKEIEGTLCNWADEYDIAIALVRPDLQIYGICDNESDLAGQVATLISRLQSQLG